MKKTFYSNGKLLLTGEYTVLDGAKALALPTKYGQYLHITPSDSKTIKWKSLDADNSIWYENEIAISDIVNNIITSDNSVTQTLITILHEAHTGNPSILKNSNGFTITTELTFPKHWGLGTSSTLINNIAQWFSIDAYQLLWKSFGGSGYDIACAQHNTPIIYQIVNNKPVVTPVSFIPDFTDKLYFVYLNQKQNSRSAIISYRENKSDISNTVAFINTTTETLLTSETVNEFALLLEKHETVMSPILNTETVKEVRFSDFNGILKSLGAWGGDFILAIAKDNPITYFKDKGYTTIIPYKDMIL
ncbi:MAG: GHMP kinase [Flavobacterium sp. MedPE-SWcel]|uniref:GYDIA family GHMP kinase n=1 Tax=uncultured Flavobacterium sp. TaxID=165435 RepID=UPI000921EADD|nr:GYDIA family GHMP kinase [uncultured Flavobacterium sp.]OIQ21790.1 MAG: GHMP kinase [Flavobacterium sp. MedPE-SWcel]